jgi:hypothetical protein
VRSVVAGQATHYSSGHEDEDIGHAIHFLERLERLSMPQAARYRDPEPVRFVLAHGKTAELTTPEVPCFALPR